MAKRRKRKDLEKGDIVTYKHDTETRKNVVPVGFASYDTLINAYKKEKVRN